MVSQELLNLLVCPETRQGLRPADSELLQRLNSGIQESRVRSRGGSVVTDQMEAALVREDGLYAYPVRNNIPVMLIEESISLESFRAAL